jgi:CBS domain-containing protein
MSLARFRKPVLAITEHETALVAARRMRDEHVGCLVVVRAARPVGILTDRDLVLRVLAEGRDPSRTPVSEVSTLDPIVVDEDSDLATAAARIRKHGVRRVPLVDREGNVSGIVTADDLVIAWGRELADLCEGLAESADSNDTR